MTTPTISRATCYLESERSLRSVAAGWAERGGLSEARLSPRALARASQHYLEIMELEWDWLEEVVAALSWENPLWLDSRLVIEPLKSSDPITSV